MVAATVTLRDGRKVKLGRKPPTKRPAVPDLGAYYTVARDVNPPPKSVDWYTKAMASIQEILGNDSEGNCVIAGKLHQIGVWTAADGPSCVVATEREALAQYRNICGPGDNGCVITDVLDHFQRVGLTAAGQLHKIDGYVSVDPRNKLMMMVALEVFGSLTLGIDLPADWTCTNCVWDVTRSRSVGGHDVCCLGYDESGVKAATWGGIVTITWPAITAGKWVEEAYCQLSPDWYGKDNVAPNGIDVVRLKTDLEGIGGGVIPDPNPPPPPPPPPPYPPPPPIVGSANIFLTTDVAAGGYLLVPVGAELQAMQRRTGMSWQEVAQLLATLLQILAGIKSAPTGGRSSTTI